MKARKMLALVLAIVITLSMMPAVAFAAPADDYNDVNGHWAESAIGRWSGYGILEGYDGRFEPNAELTRGQLAAIIARLLNLPEAETAEFSDVDGHWAEDVIKRCAEAGIMLGSEGKARPDDKVTREETMVLLGRALGIEPADEKVLDSFPDPHNVSSWAKGYVAALTEKGIVNGLHGHIQPGVEIDRASTVTILNKAISAYANEDGQTVKAEGNGIVLVAANNVTVTGEADAVVVAQGAAGGKTTIEDAKINEVTVVAGGTEVVLAGETEAKEVKVAETATAAKVEVTETAKVETVKTEAEKTEVAVSGTVTNVEVSDKATETKVEAAAGSTITNVDNKAEGTTVAGEGKVENVATSGNNTKVETGGTKVEAAEGTTGTTAGGNKVESGSSSTTTPTTPSTPSTPSGSGSGSSGSSSTPTHTHKWGAWTSNEDGTHSRSRTCGHSKTETETCADATEDGLCDVCGFMIGAVARIDDAYYTSVTEAINEAEDGAVIYLLPVTISEAIDPWGGDSTHAVEKSIVLLGANYENVPGTADWDEDNATVLTGGLRLGYDDGHTRNHSVTIKGVTFQNKGVMIIDEKDVVIENNIFEDIESGSAITVCEQNKDGEHGSTVIRNNIIDTVSGSGCVGIEVRNPYDADISYNKISNTNDNGIQLTGGVSGLATVTDNEITDWGTNGSTGRGLRAVILDGAGFTFSNNTFVNDNPPEEYIKVDGAGALDALENTPWSGNTINGWAVATRTEGSTVYGEISLAGSFDLDPETGNYVISNLAGLKHFRDTVNAGDTYSGKTVVLAADIDLAGENWEPIGKTFNVYEFKGIFDGMNHTISNFKVDNKQGSALFGFVRGTGSSVKNLTVSGVVATGGDYVGGIVGQLYGTIENCHAINVNATATPFLLGNGNYDGGAKAGGVVGWMESGSIYTATNCTATNVTINAYRDLGGVIGMAHNYNIITNCKTFGGNLYYVDLPEGGTYDGNKIHENMGEVIGRRGTNVNETGTAFENVTLHNDISE